ncbi:ATP-binding protein [Microbacterium thalli]|uniref:ATP-binding protein n=1 Tax=Microbacterium thalli TaxID=3027921 RepID=UPI0023667732|nr:ATP-binding protein [Microbacterium thalli]MDD7930781.1 ATP-binding protein [Microbacterium thalli]
MSRQAAWMRARPRTLARMGFIGAGGGRWNRVPKAPLWYSSSVQACGIYPFVTGTARPVSGVPLGRDLLTGTAVAMDHHSLYMEGVISSPSMFMFGINGVGKSSTAQTIQLGMMARGMVPAVFNPLKKGEHTPLVEQAGGKVFEFGPTARHQLNLLSRGPLGRAADIIGGQAGEEVNRLATWKVVQQAQAALRVSRGVPLDDIDDAVIEAMVTDILARNRRPVTSDLSALFYEPSARVLAVSGFEDAKSFRARFARLGESLRAMLGGDLGRLLGGTESIEIDPGNRGGFCFDTSSIPATATKLLSTAMLMSWSMGMDAIDAHWELAQHEERIAAEAADAGEIYTPAVTWTGFTTLMDEFWYPMRSTPGIVDRVDALSRSNRSVGTAEMKITHSPKDMLSLRDEEDRMKARGLAERSGVLALLALTGEDLQALGEVKPLTAEEIRLVSGFNAAKTWRSRPMADGRQAAPPGAGKVLFKVEGRPGVPVQMVQTPTQKGLHITDERFRKQSETIRTRRAG